MANRAESGLEESRSCFGKPTAQMHSHFYLFSQVRTRELKYWSQGGKICVLVYFKGVFFSKNTHVLYKQFYNKMSQDFKPENNAENNSLLFKTVEK